MANYIRIDASTIDREHICCALGNDAENTYNAATKKEWMRARFDEGLVFYRLNERGKVFVEYMPSEYCWKPIEAENWFVIDCLWVSGSFKGKGHSRELLEHCVEDARKQKKAGLLVVSSAKKKPFLTDKDFFLRYGFSVADRAEPYFELLELKLGDSAAKPRFLDRVKRPHTHDRGLYLVYSNQCPFMERYVELFRKIAVEQGLHCEKKRLESHLEARELGSPFGTFGVYYNGRFLTHELMTEAKIAKFLRENCVKPMRGSNA